jgi:hypothetical protein
MREPDTNHNADALALQALAWTLADDDRARRLLDLTGLEPGELRARAAEPVVLAAALGFLEAREADLVAAAEALGVRPEALVRARAALEAGA